MVKVGGEDVKIKNVVIEDESGHAKYTYKENQCPPGQANFDPRAFI
jgi:hypothetical protein